jgi:hypothetical protein
MRTGFVNKLLKKSDKVVRMRVDNPNVTITGMDNIYIKEDKKWHQTTAFKLGVGMLIGVAVGVTAK